MKQRRKNNLKSFFINIFVKKGEGFTLIELLIVIAIIAILASVIFVGLDPLTRFKDSRDSTRWRDITAILDAIKINQIDNDGEYLPDIVNMNDGDIYMITNGSVTTGCDTYDNNCDVDVTGSNYCINLAPLVENGYLGDMPISPDGDFDWSSTELTGYTLIREDTGIIIIQACNSENSDDIWLAK